ncbi:F-box/LRR-repeat protein At4g14103-like [Carex rostrata]
MMKNTKIHNDRISDLPDELLIHILSFLKTKEAVQTCVLSQRWRNLWTSVPCLYFDFDDFLPDHLDFLPDDLAFHDDDLKEYETKFEQFVSAELRNQGTSNLGSFKLSYNNRYGKSDSITEWILYSFNCKPQELARLVLSYTANNTGNNEILNGLSNATNLELITFLSGVLHQSVNKSPFSKGWRMKNTKIHNDRISDLPDELLIHVLSFLKTKEAMQTCVLSQRWRNLWTFVPNLDLDDGDLKEYEIKFEQFVSTALRNRGTSNLDSFKLHYNNSYGNSDAITEWILYSLHHKPRELFLYVYRYKEIDLPDLLFACKSLEKMDLWLDFLSYKNLKTISLPSLKTLELSAWIIDDYVMNKLTSGCPVLEDLSLRWCNVGTHIISSNQLKHLFIDDFLSQGEIQISIPSLTSLVIHSSRGLILLKNMSSLVKAHLVLSYDANIANQEILNGLSNATNLEFDFTGQGFMVILEKELLNCPTFKNLKSLHFDGYVIGNFHLIALFLQHAPNLEKLTLTHYELPPADAYRKNTSKTETRDSQCEYVPLVEIISKADHERVDQLVKTLHTYVKSIGKLNMYMNSATEL